MPQLRITADRIGLRLHGATAPLVPALRRALAADAGPVTVMVHGYKYLPGDPQHCPYTGILSHKPQGQGARVVSWPRHLGLRGQRGEGLGISFGWDARGSVWRAWRRAEGAGDQLAGLIAQLRKLAPGRAIHIVAHSMGARVALRAIHQGQPGAVRCAILLAAAEFEQTAARAIDAAGPDTQVLNVTSRENDVFDFLLERLVPAPQRGARMLGNGRLDRRNLVTLQLDDPASLDALRRAGFPIAQPMRRVCHWSPYLRPGVFPLYRSLLRGQVDLVRLRALLPGQASPRWSRLAPALPQIGKLPGFRPARRGFGQI
ncbi:alpha/beta hydrolase [Tropicibacter oceani]|uniref:Alpha/beta hydrolase n=1 Tax=Tropicibacter oceani TaxID=3058420 RepID=A0ABY8QE42_9RHOB|nr:alpha/beta hydrolase [Tropicibacter oceani]WGW02311.1 alpha/beta hydrolase [Tropicibacter oceani]